MANTEPSSSLFTIDETWENERRSALEKRSHNFEGTYDTPMRGKQMDRFNDFPLASSTQERDRGHSTNPFADAFMCQSELPKKPNTVRVMPDRYDGSVPWPEYFAHFESCAKINGWDGQERVSFLCALLKGPAQQILSDGSLGIQPSYQDLILRLQRRFGIGQQAETYLAQLRGLVKLETESLQECGQKVRQLTALAYPDLPPGSKDRLARGHFQDAITDPEIRTSIFRARPENLDQAIQVALETESFLALEHQRNSQRRNKFSRTLAPASAEKKVSDDGTDELRLELREMRKMMSELSTTVKDLKNASSAVNLDDNPKPLTCFYCKEKGHFKRDCPKLQKKRQENEKGFPQRS